MAPGLVYHRRRHASTWHRGYLSCLNSKAKRVKSERANSDFSTSPPNLSSLFYTSIFLTENDPRPGLKPSPTGGASWALAE